MCPKIKLPHLLLLVFAALFFIGCQKESPVKQNRVIIGISSDIESFNPLYAFSVDEGSISELLYLSLVQMEWNDQEGVLVAKPMLAENWNWNEDSSAIHFVLRKDVNWSDGQPFTAEDVAFSFDVYSDPDVQSKLYGTFENFFADGSNHIDIEKTFDIKSPYELTINFPAGSVPKIVDIAIPLIPKHIFGKIERKNIPTAEANFSPVSNGPFKLKKWDRNQLVVLEANKESFLYNPDKINEIYFKIVPDYTSRITQLKKGEIDLIELVRNDDVDDLESQGSLVIAAQKGREYDYVGWNNIDPEIFNKNGKLTANKFFGSANVRIALTHAINRKEILEEYLKNFGTLAVGPVSPIFKKAFNTDIKPYEYNPNKAKDLLKREGWADNNNNGTIDKNGLEFSFSLVIPPENPLRTYAATVIKNNLKAVGVDINIETMELGAFIDNVYGKKLNAWMVSWYIPIPQELKNYWYSDIEKTPSNLASYRNKKIDRILDRMEQKISEDERNGLYKEFQEIIHQDEPVTFLYWKDNIAAYNKKIKNIDINPYGVVHHCWQWSVEE